MSSISEVLKIGKTAWKGLKEKPWDKRHGKLLKQAYENDPNSALGKQWPAWKKKYGDVK